MIYVSGILSTCLIVYLHVLWGTNIQSLIIEMKNGRVDVRQQSLTHSIWFLCYLPFIQDQSFSAFLYGYPGLFLEIAIIVLLYHDL
jgi:hypothetical protein